MEDSENTSNLYMDDDAKKLYQLLLTINSKGAKDTDYERNILLSSEMNVVTTTTNKAASLEKEAQEIIKVFTNSSVKTVFKEFDAKSSSSAETALVPVGYYDNVKNVPEKKGVFKIDFWKRDETVTTVETSTDIKETLHYISITINESGGFEIIGLEHLNEKIQNAIKDIGNLMAIDDCEIFDSENLKTISGNINQLIEIPLGGGLLKFTANQNPIDVLAEIYPTELTSDNKRILKIPDVGNILIDPEEDPIDVFRAITGYDLSKFYKSTVSIQAEVENKENKNHRNKKSKKRSKKNKQKRKSKNKK